MKWPFLGSFVCFGLLNMFQSCWHFYQRQSSWIKKMWLENILKVSILAPMGCTQSKIKVKIKGKFLGPIYTQKTKNSKIFPKTKFLALSNNINTKSQKNHRILVKLSKKNWGRGQNGYKLPPWDQPNRNSQPIASPFFHSLSIPSFSVCLYTILNFTWKIPLFLGV